MRGMRSKARKKESNEKIYPAEKIEKLKELLPELGLKEQKEGQINFDLKKILDSKKVELSDIDMESIEKGGCFFDLSKRDLIVWLIGSDSLNLRVRKIIAEKIA